MARAGSDRVTVGGWLRACAAVRDRVGSAPVLGQEQHFGGGDRVGDLRNGRQRGRRFRVDCLPAGRDRIINRCRARRQQDRNADHGEPGCAHSRHDPLRVLINKARTDSRGRVRIPGRSSRIQLGKAREPMVGAGFSRCLRRARGARVPPGVPGAAPLSSTPAAAIDQLAVVASSNTGRPRR